MPGQDCFGGFFFSVSSLFFLCFFSFFIFSLAFFSPKASYSFGTLKTSRKRPVKDPGKNVGGFSQISVVKEGCLL